MKAAVVFVLALCVGSCAIAAPEIPADSTHADLSAALWKTQTGQLIRIKTGAGMLEGKFQGMAPAGVRVMNPSASPAPIVILADSVRTVEKESRHTERGMLIGLIVGAGVGYLLGSAGHSSDSIFTEAEQAALGAVGFGALGMAVGAAMGHNYKTWTVIYP